MKPLVPPAELYRDPSLREGVPEAYRPFLDNYTASLASITEHPDTLAYLDSLGKAEDIELLLNARTVFGFLPPEILRYHYGDEALIWTAANVAWSEVQARHRAAVSDLLGHDQDRFLKAWRWEREHRPGAAVSAENLIAQLAVMNKVMDGGLKDIDFHHLLRNAALPGVELSQKRLQDYALTPLKIMEGDSGGRVENWHGDIEPTLRYRLWQDAPAGYGLFYKGRPNAQAAVAVVDNRELMLYQLQGVRPERLDPAKIGKAKVIGRVAARGLMPLDWRKCLIEVAAGLASSLGLQSLGIQEGKQNKWVSVQPGDTEPHLTVEQAVAAYDTPAQRLGFERGANGNWYRTVPSSL